MTEEKLIQIYKDAKETTDRFGYKDIGQRKSYFLLAVTVALVVESGSKDPELINTLYDMIY